MDRRGYGILRALMTLPLVVPPAVTGLMFLLLEDNQYGVLSYYLGAFGIIDPNKPILGTTALALPGVMLTDIWQWTPFMVLIFHAALSALPREPFEAAAIDGAGAIAAFRHLTLPMLGRVIALAVLLRGIDLFRIYDYIYVMTSGGPGGTATETISYYAGKIFGLANFPYSATLSIRHHALVGDQAGLRHLILKSFSTTSPIDPRQRGLIDASGRIGAMSACRWLRSRRAGGLTAVLCVHLLLDRIPPGSRCSSPRRSGPSR